MAGTDNWAERLEQALLAVDRLTARRLLTEALRDMPAFAAVDALVVPALERIGNKWERGEAALSQIYMSGRICEGLVDDILPRHAAGREQRSALAVAALQDHHYLGKNLVLSALRAGGFFPLDLGHVTADTLPKPVRDHGVRVLLLSTLMLPSALKVKDVRSRLAAEGLQVKIVVGGAPFRFDPQLWREVGADACGRNASDAIAIVRGLMPASGAQGETAK